MAAVSIIFVILVVVAWWFAASSMDKDRIAAYVGERDGRIVSINWAPFGVGWFGEKNSRIYEVVYYDKAGNQHFATCKTSLLSGVSWTEDRISHGKAAWYDSLSPGNEPGNPVIGHLPKEAAGDNFGEVARLREENARLRQALDEKSPAAE
jgi:hypothetical protein